MTTFKHLIYFGKTCQLIVALTSEEKNGSGDSKGWLCYLNVRALKCLLCVFGVFCLLFITFDFIYFILCFLAHLGVRTFSCFSLGTSFMRDDLCERERGAGLGVARKGR